MNTCIKVNFIYDTYDTHDYAYNGVNNKITTHEVDGLETYLHFACNMKTGIWSKLRDLISHWTTTSTKEEVCEDKGCSKEFKIKTT